MGNTTDFEQEVFDKLGLTDEQICSMSLHEKAHLVESYRLANILNENKPDELYEGYYTTNMFDTDGKFNIKNATNIIMSKDSVLDVVKKYIDFSGSLPQFVLLGDEKTDSLVNEALKKMNQKNAEELSKGKDISSDDLKSRRKDRDIIENSRIYLMADVENGNARSYHR